MVDVAKVSIFGIPVGVFNWDDRYGAARFEYDQSFIGRGLEPSPLIMPVREGRVYSFARIKNNAKCAKVLETSKDRTKQNDLRGDAKPTIR